MSNAADLQNTMNRIKEEEEFERKSYFKEEDDVEYMSDMSNWLCVHVTRYLPKRGNKSKKLFIKTTASATHYDYSRATVHVTLNELVGSNSGGNWDDAPFVILAPYNDVVQENGNPAEIAAMDTYFVPNPDTGLVLPDSACIIKPDNSCLFKLGDKIATYKTDHFTDEEIETILSLSGKHAEYKRLLSGEVSDDVAESLLGFDDKLIKLYNNSKDKPAFMRGILEEARMIILTNYLRDAVVYMMMEKMGYKHIRSNEGPRATKIAEVARSAGIKGNSSNKGHSDSIEKKLEHIGLIMLAIVQALESATPETIYSVLIDNAFDMEDLDDHFGLKTFVIESIMSNPNVEPLDIYQIYKNAFVHIMNNEKKEKTEDINNITIADYNPYLDKVLQRNATKLQKRFALLIAKLKLDPKYEDFRQKLHRFVQKSTLSEEELIALDKTNKR